MTRTKPCAGVLLFLGQELQRGWRVAMMIREATSGHTDSGGSHRAARRRSKRHSSASARETAASPTLIAGSRRSASSGKHFNGALT